MKKNLFFILLISTILLKANSFEEYSKQQNQKFSSYKDSFEKEFETYKKAYEKSLKSYKKEISNNWPDTEVSTAHKFVQYNSNYNSKKSVDFEKESIEVEVIASSEKEARKKIQSALIELINEDVKNAYEHDQLEKKINIELNQTPKVVTKDKIIGDVLSKNEKKEFIEVTQTKPLEKQEYKDKTIFKLNVKLPSQAIVQKAQKFQTFVNEYSKKNNINKELIYAVIHSESSFNPMARSHIPAYGLMQIVPKSAGIDASFFVYGEKKVLSSQYLYNPSNNIKIGAAYLHIVYFKYLRHIKDPQSRLYCSIAAYNTGAGNVARSFIGSNNIVTASKKINTMSADEVYKHLMKNLPYNETKDYLKRVNDRRFAYLKLLEDEKL